jgi:hypothetical protein
MGKLGCQRVFGKKALNRFALSLANMDANSQLIACFEIRFDAGLAIRQRHHF